MNRFRSTFRSFVLALSVGGLLVAAPASALPVSSPAYTKQVRTVASDCYAIGQEVAAQNGGTLAKASSASRGEQEVCVIVVLVPGQEGERPRRVEMVVPAG